MSVIIPARNEAAVIETVLRSVLRSTYEPFEVLVVDDRSTDDTSAIVTRIEATDPRVRLVRGAELPAGWYGKPWACYEGYQASRGELLLFTDADTHHQPALLGHAVGAVAAQAADLVTVAPRQLCETFWERVIMPQVWLLLALRYHPAVVNRARHPRDVIANGQFILVTRTAYEAAGTHERVRGQIAEDLALAQTFLKCGFRIFFAFAEQLMETRMYRGLGHLIEGWSKNVYLGGRQSYPGQPLLQALVPVFLIAAVGFWLLPPIVGVLALVWASPAMLAPALAASGLSVLFWAVICLGMRLPIGYSLLYPLGAAMTLYIILRSTWRGGRRVEWKGREYRGMGE